MKNLRVFETTQQQESKINSIDYAAVLLNNENGTITVISNEGSDTYTLRFTYVTEYAGEQQTYFRSSSGNAPILETEAIVKIDGEVVELNPFNTSHTFAVAGEHTIDFIINKEYNQIPAYSFADCDFTGVTIPDNINEIESSAFAPNSISDDKPINIIIPSSVTTIGRSAFDNINHIEYYGSATWNEDEENFDIFWGACSMNDYKITCRFYNNEDTQNYLEYSYTYITYMDVYDLIRNISLEHPDVVTPETDESYDVYDSIEEGKQHYVLRYSLKSQHIKPETILHCFKK